MELEFKVEAFSGPLELLLHLIEKNKVNIYDIPIVEITEQYIDYVSKMDSEDMDTMSEFLVMAATLIRIKSKMLLPKEEKDEEISEDPRAELVERLIEYKKIKYAAQELKDMEIGAGQSIYRKKDLPKEVLEYEPTIDASEVIKDTNIDLARLNKIFNEVMKRMTDKVDPVRSKFGKIEKEKISVEDKIIDIRAKIKGLSGIHFKSLLMAETTRLELVVTFLAILELMKSGLISVRQNTAFGEIYLDSLEG
ncbi:MAG: segregation/condensation protein A [Lachnospiraceae bacterium]|nr:segregation/condensation protein A [Lachnospiraceae bacterium]